MKVLFAALALVTVVACGKKVEPAAAPVNPQITDSVNQFLPPVETVDAGVPQSLPQAPVTLPVK
jgi:hypothetical protein